MKRVVIGILYAIDAVSVTQLYSSNNSCAGDAINPATKFSVPTVANGCVLCEPGRSDIRHREMSHSRQTENQDSR